MRGLSEVAEGIYLLNIEQPLFSGTNVYLIKDNIITLIDVGHSWWPAVDNLERLLRLLGLKLTDVDQAIYTHSHIDHMGAGALLESQKLWRAKNLACQGVAENKSNYADYIKYMKGLSASWAAKEPALKNLLLNNEAMQKVNSYFTPYGPITIDYSLVDHQKVSIGGRHLEVLYTPGHSPDHLCLYEKETGILFSGDLILDHGPTIMPGSGGDVRQFFDSCARLKEYPIKQILPAHGNILSEEHIEVSYNRIKRQAARVLLPLREEPQKFEQLVYNFTGGKAADFKLPFTLVELVDAYLRYWEKEGVVSFNQNTNRWQLN